MSKSEVDYEKICTNCENAVPICDDANVLCRLKGIVGKAYSCKKFEYDLLKRVPSAAQTAPEFEYIDIDKDI